MRPQLVALREGQPIHRDLGQIVEDRYPVARGVVVGGAVGHFHEQAARSFDEERQEMVGGDEVRLDASLRIRSPLSRSCRQMGVFQSQDRP
jgi:hypothetical protein